MPEDVQHALIVLILAVSALIRELMAEKRHRTRQRRRRTQNGP